MPSHSSASVLASGALALVAALMLACSGGGSGTPPTRVVVQLTSGGMTYWVDRIEVSIQKAGGAVLTGVTDAKGVARISVPDTGAYDVIKMQGVDASQLPEGSEGREFVKPTPLVDPYPSLTYTAGSPPTVTVGQTGLDYPVDFPVPALIQRVKVLKVGQLTGGGGLPGLLQAGAGPFAGRVLVSNLSTSDAFAAIVFHSSTTDQNRLILYSYKTGDPVEYGPPTFYGGPNPQAGDSLGFVNSYTHAGPLSFEASGTNGGEWALGCASSLTDLKTRNGLGGPGATRDFPAFGGGTTGSDYVLRLYSTAGSPSTYSLDYRILGFETF